MTKINQENMSMDTRKLYRFLELFCQIMLVLFVFLIFWEIFKTSDLGTLAAWHVILNVSGVSVLFLFGAFFKVPAQVDIVHSKNMK